ncbi:MAG: response regulator [Fibrobacter sp.]|nr:response regulator [Fibrobacter sp.]
METNIILADDDRFYQMLIAENIRNDCRKIQLVKSGSEVLKILENQEVDLLVIDYHLEDLTADMVIERMRLRGYKVPVIVMTGDESLETERTVRSCGADYYFVKPIELHDFEIVVNSLTRKNDKYFAYR